MLLATFGAVVVALGAVFVAFGPRAAFGALLATFGALSSLRIRPLAIEPRLLRLGFGLARRALGGLGPLAGALRRLGGTARVAHTAQVAFDGPLQPLPGSGLLLALP